MTLYEKKQKNKDFLKTCPLCEEGYMFPTFGEWYQCSNCGSEAEKNKFGNFTFAVNIDLKEYSSKNK